MEVSLSILKYYNDNNIEQINKFVGHIKYLHLDVMDGKFVNNKTFDEKLIKKLSFKYPFVFDTHLMIEKPEEKVIDYIKAGSDYVTFHVEASKDPKALIDLIHGYNVKAGISIKPNTDIESIKAYLSNLDMVLIMSVEPGAGGQTFLTNAIDKVKILKELKNKNNYNYLINIDGGINVETLKLVKNYVDIAVCGSYITTSIDPLNNLKLLKNI